MTQDERWLAKYNEVKPSLRPTIGIPPSTMQKKEDCIVTGSALWFANKTAGLDL